MEIKENKKFNLNQIISIRQEIHENPEIGFEEVETGKRIIKYLTETCKLNVDSIRTNIGRTGIVVDIIGKAEPSGNNFCIAFRADMDCLPIEEETPNITYKSKTKNRSHSCGHDGHVAVLLGFAAQIVDNIEKIPSNKKIRLIFQPAEECCHDGYKGGALKMIEDGCLEGVNEIYGFHNAPIFDFGYLAVKDGPIMASANTFKIKIIGKGGHASTPHLTNNPVDAAVDVYKELKSISKSFIDRNKKIVLCFPVFKAGDADNVIPDFAYLGGALRTLEEGLDVEVINEMRLKLPDVCSKHNCTIDFQFADGYSVLVNPKEQADIVEKLGCNYFNDKMIEKHLLPVMGSEDFTYYLHKVPGCFFFVGTKDPTDQANLHSSKFNFNDGIIEIVCRFYLQIVEHRFDLPQNSLN